jgi:hypothetical protein
MPHDHIAISAVLQRELRRRRREVTAVEAATWLDQAHILEDSPSRPGLPLRRLLRAGRIEGAEQHPSRPYGRWFITRLAR